VSHGTVVFVTFFVAAGTKVRGLYNIFAKNVLLSFLADQNKVLFWKKCTYLAMILYTPSHFLQLLVSMACFSDCKLQAQLNKLFGYRLLKQLIVSDVFTICINVQCLHFGSRF